MIFKMRKLIVLAAVFSIAVGVFGAESVSPVRKAMQGFVDRNVISGGVKLVANKNRLLQLETVGYSDLTKCEAMREDHFFWIASMTKPLVGVCILMLLDEGKLSV